MGLEPESSNVAKERLIRDLREQLANALSQADAMRMDMAAIHIDAALVEIDRLIGNF